MLSGLFFYAFEVKHFLFSIFSFILFFNFSLGSLAQKNDDSVVVNQVLFELKKDAYTMLDLKKYLTLKSVFSHHEVLIILSKNLKVSEVEEFLLLCMAYLEAQNLDLKLDAQNDKTVKDPLLRRYLLALQYLELKQRTLLAGEKYKPWFEILKRKYNFSAKTDIYQTTSLQAK